MSEIRLSLDEMRELLPLYVAHTLNRDQAKAVEAGLQEFPELHEDLKSWRAIAAATQSRAESASAEHLKPEAIVEYVENPDAMDSTQRASIVEHVRACSACRDDLARVRSSFPARTATLWRYAAAAVILLALLGSFLAVETWRQKSELEEAVTLHLTFVESYRSPGTQALPIPRLEIAEHTKSIVLNADVPLPLKQISQLTWSLRDPAQRWTDIDDPVRTGIDSTGYAVVWFELPVSTFSRAGAHALRAVSPSEGEFIYEFVVSRR